MGHFVVAGHEVAAEYQALMAAAKAASRGHDDLLLVRAQQAIHAKGFCEVEIVESIYGFSVRYASGLDNFGLVRPARGSKDPSLEAAIKFCEEWCAVDPKRRFASMWSKERND